MAETHSGGRESVEDGATELSLGGLVAEASESLRRLVRLELELAKMELAENAGRVAKSSALFIVAAALGHLVLILASVTLGLGLWALGLALWLSFLIVTLLYLVIAGVLVGVGVRKLRGLSGVPRTRSSLSKSLAVVRRERSTDE